MTGRELLALLKTEPNGASANIETWREIVLALDGCVLLTADEAEKVRGAVTRGASDIEFAHGRQAWVDEALALLSAGKEPA